MPIPFSLNPKFWGLKGIERERAEARYTLSGEALERKLLDIDYPAPRSPEIDILFRRCSNMLDLKWNRITQIEYDRNLLALDCPNKRSIEYRQGLLDIRFEHGEIEEYEYDNLTLRLAHRNHESVGYRLEKAAIDLKHERLTQDEYDKEIASINQEPWVKVIEAGLIYDPDEGNRMSFRLDWNEFFVQDLMNHGYRGNSQEEIVDLWFNDTCREIFNPDPEYLGLDEDGPSSPTGTTTRRSNEGDSTEYS